MVSQKIFSLGDKFTIKNEGGEDCYYVQGKVFSMGNKLHFYDLSGNERFYIEQKLFRFLPEYILFSEGKEVARVKKEFTFFKPSFIVNSIYGNINIQGDIFSHEFAVNINEQCMATVSKQWFTFGDHYGVDVSAQADDAFILALIIVLDQVIYDGNKNR
jgi:uncharacterized protein YxjI